MKAFFSKIGNWFKNHVPTRRRIIQVYAALLYNANIKGFFSGRIYSTDFSNSTKIICVPGMNCYSCPGAIGACPLGALQNALEASETRTPYYLLGILLLFGLMLGRTICGFLCPAGLLQELLYKIKTPKLKKNSYTRVFSYTKYVILVALVIVIPMFINSPTFCKYICPVGTFEGGIGLLSNPNNTDYLAMLGSIFTWKFAVLVVIIVLCIFIYRFFCRFICPLGAIYGFFNKFALIGIKLNKDKCTECGLCVSQCKMDIRHVGDHECINCGECIPVCPTKAISWKGSQLFVHGNEIETPEQTTALATVLETGTTVNTDEKIKPLEVVAVNAESAQTVSEVVVADGTAEAEETVEKHEKKRKPVNLAKRNKILETVAWSLAGILLVFALVYYNFLVPENKVEGIGVGKEASNFTLQVYDGDGLNSEYTLADSLEEGKVVILNFWATTCNPCIHELPYFNRLKQKYGDEVEVIAIHSISVIKQDPVQDFINNPERHPADHPELDSSDWSTYAIIFAQDARVIEYKDKMITAFEAFGGKDAYPVTAIINSSGVFSYLRQGSVSYDSLEKAFLQVRDSK